MIYSILSGLIVVGSSLWAAIDAHKNRTATSAGAYTIRSAVFWGLGCLVLWIIVFPYYLFTRDRQLRQGGDAPRATVGSLAGVGVIVALLLVWGLSIAVGERLSTPALAQQVRDSIQSTWSSNPRLAGTGIDSLTLVHKQGNEYDGTIEYHTGTKRATAGVDVTYDGRNIRWKVHQK